MNDLGPVNDRISRLQEIADGQFGYFTARQAVEAGYSYQNQKYHLSNDKSQWLKVSTGLFRLPGYPDSMESDFARLSLWSRNQQDQPQGIISHRSALALHGFGQYDQIRVHLTVPLRFRKKLPDEVIIHKASLNLSAIESHGCFMVTRLGQTLEDMRTDLEENNEWEKTILKVAGSGKLAKEELQRFGCAIKLGDSANRLAAESQNSNSLTGADSLSGEVDSGASNVFDSVSEGVWKMIFDRSEAGRKRSRAGFTLVELLVVIAIISILAAMLMPALNKAMDSARSSSCQNNMRQIMTATMQYASDSGEYLPIFKADEGGSVGYEMAWYWAIWPYLGDGDLVFTTKNLSNTIFWDSSFTEWTIVSNENPVWARILSYGLNTFYGPDANSKTYSKIGYSGRPSQSMFYFDSFGRSYVSINVAQENRFPFHFRHGQNSFANFAFLDGHVQGLPFGGCQTNIQRTPFWGYKVHGEP